MGDEDMKININKRHRESDHLHNASAEPPLKNLRNATLDDTLGDLVTTQDNRLMFSIQSLTRTAQVFVPVLNPVTHLFENLETICDSKKNTKQPKRKRTNNPNEPIINPDETLKEKQAEKAAIVVSELKLSKSPGRDGPAINEHSGHHFDDFSHWDKPSTENAIASSYFKSQNEVQLRMGGRTVSNYIQGASKGLSACGDGSVDIPRRLKDTDSTNNNNSQRTVQKKPKQLLDWSDCEDDLDDQANRTPLPADCTAAQVILDADSTDTDQTDSSLVSLHDAASYPFRVPRMTVDALEVDRYLTEHLPNLNGNYDGNGHFKEWNETLTVESYKGKPLHILPYTIIDF